jgi:hypothetical protein
VTPFGANFPVENAEQRTAVQLEQDDQDYKDRPEPEADGTPPNDEPIAESKAHRNGTSVEEASSNAAAKSKVQNEADKAGIKDEPSTNVEAVETSATPRSVRGHKERTGQSEAGIIKQICVENFMCHRTLRVDLNRNVNFICGQNGSGKSAILAAIQIGLGANARLTNRARNLKDLVRKDVDPLVTPSAKIHITLLNSSSDGYKYEIYGDSITVQRTISSRGGYNGHKLLDHNMKVQSRSKKDLDDMLDTL